MKDIMNVTYVSRYEFEDDKGKKMQGTKIIYEGRCLKEDTKKGIEAVIMNCDDYSAFNQFPVVPGTYEIEFAIVPTSKGTKMVFLNAVYIEDKKKVG